MNKRKTIISILFGLVFLGVIWTFYTTFSLEDGYQIKSDVYEIEDGMIKNISPYTSVSLFYKHFELENCSIQVMDISSHEIADSYVVNGSKTILYDNNHQVIGSYINVIQGDFLGDGIINYQDFNKIGYSFVHGGELVEYQIQSMDLDGDGVVRLNDLLLLDKSYQLGYESIEIINDNLIYQSNESRRLLTHIKPSYGVNQNLNWTSSNEEVATVDESGMVIGHNEGESVIRCTTFDGKVFDEVVVKVDNTIQLSSYEGVGYVNGKDTYVSIKLIDYDGVSCLSSNESIANCQIQDKKLIVKAVGEGSSIITVTSPNYGSATYRFTSYSTYLNVMPKYLCVTPGNVQLITVGALHTGDLSFEIGDKEVIKSASMMMYQGRNMLRIEFGEKQGRTTLKVTESNGNASNIVTVDTYRVTIPQIGSQAVVGEDVSTTIVGDNLGVLSCSSEDENKATCSIEGNKLIVHPLSTGDVTITVHNVFRYDNYDYDCGKATFLVVIR